jgi:hypothetical protein
MMFQETKQYRVRIKDGHWMGCWVGLHCSALTQVENKNSSCKKNSSWSYSEKPSWHKMTVAVNMARNDQEMEQQMQAVQGENKNKE